MEYLFENFRKWCQGNRHLLKVQIALTDKCNLKCRHCYVSPQPEPILNFKEIRAILSQLKKMGCLFLVFSGGELFTREDIFKIIEYAADKQFCTAIMTNGTFIDRGVAKFLKRNFIFNVVLSLHGATPETHDKFTQQAGSFNKTMDAIVNLKKERQSFLITYLVTKYNSGEVGDMKRLQKEMNLSVNYPSLIVSRENGQKLPEDFNISRGAIRKLFAYKEKTGLCDIPRPNLDEPVCGVWLYACHISAYGKVRPCVVYPSSYTVGDLRKEPFKKIWEKDIYVNGISIKNITFRDFGNCYSCNLLSYCHLCPAYCVLEGDRLGPMNRKCILARLNKESEENERRSYCYEKK